MRWIEIGDAGHDSTTGICDVSGHSADDYGPIDHHRIDCNDNNYVDNNHHNVDNNYDHLNNHDYLDPGHSARRCSF